MPHFFARRSGFSADAPEARVSDAASFTVRREGSVTHLDIGGVWTVRSLHQVDSLFHDAADNTSDTVKIHLEGLTRLDTAGALLINEGLALFAARHITPELTGVTGDQRRLLEKSVPPELPAKALPKAPYPARIVNSLGERVCDELRTMGQLVGFWGHFLVTLGLVVLHPVRMRWTSLTFHMEQTGLRAVPIVALLTFLIGMVVAYMGSQELAKFGAQVFSVNLLAVTIMREMGVLITAIVVAGRSSSSFTAQIGAMVANEEVAAIRSMGLEPMELLVVPRVFSLMLTLPLLVFIADVMALLGGALAMWYSMDLGFNAFLSRFYAIAQLNHFLVGMTKTPFFALAIGVVGCFQGFRAGSSAESVGFLTTVSVVQAIFIVILLDAMFAMFFTAIGI